MSCVASAFMAINYQFIGESPPLWQPLWMLEDSAMHAGLWAWFTLVHVPRSAIMQSKVSCCGVICTRTCTHASHGRNADKGQWGERMCDLVGNAARSGAITCVVSRRHPTILALSIL